MSWFSVPGDADCPYITLFPNSLNFADQPDPALFLESNLIGDQPVTGHPVGAPGRRGRADPRMHGRAGGWVAAQTRQRATPQTTRATRTPGYAPAMVAAWWKDKSGITSLRLCFPQDQLKLSHCATRLCPCGFRFRRVVAMHEASPSRPFDPFRRARPGAFAAMQPTAPIRHGRSPARSCASASLCSAARACIGDCKARFP